MVSFISVEISIKETKGFHAFVRNVGDIPGHVPW